MNPLKCALCDQRVVHYHNACTSATTRTAEKGNSPRQTPFYVAVCNHQKMERHKKKRWTKNANQFRAADMQLFALFLLLSFLCTLAAQTALVWTHIFPPFFCQSCASLLISLAFEAITWGFPLISMNMLFFWMNVRILWASLRPQSTLPSIYVNRSISSTSNAFAAASDNGSRGSKTCKDVHSTHTHTHGFDPI